MYGILRFTRDNGGSWQKMGELVYTDDIEASARAELARLNATRTDQNTFYRLMLPDEMESRAAFAVSWYARLSGYGGHPTREVYAVVNEQHGVMYDDDTDAYYAAHAFADDNELVETVVYFDYLYRRCARIRPDDARSLQPLLYAHVEALRQYHGTT